MATSAPTAEDRLVTLGIRLPAAPTPFVPYVPAVQRGNPLFLSGMVATSGHAAARRHRGQRPGRDGGLRGGAHGRAQRARAGEEATRPLNRVSRVVRLGVYVAEMPEVAEHPKVTDATSELLRGDFGEEAFSARLVFGVSSLPLGSPVEVEVILGVKA